MHLPLPFYSALAWVLIISLHGIATAQQDLKLPDDPLELAVKSGRTNPIDSPFEFLSPPESATLMLGKPFRIHFETAEQEQVPWIEDVKVAFKIGDRDLFRNPINVTDFSMKNFTVQEYKEFNRTHRPTYVTEWTFRINHTMTQRLPDRVDYHLRFIIIGGMPGDYKRENPQRQIIIAETRTFSVRLALPPYLRALRSKSNVSSDSEQPSVKSDATPAGTSKDTSPVLAPTQNSRADSTARVLNPDRNRPPSQTIISPPGTPPKHWQQNARDWPVSPEREEPTSSKSLFSFPVFELVFILMLACAIIFFLHELGYLDEAPSYWKRFYAIILRKKPEPERAQPEKTLKSAYDEWREGLVQKYDPPEKGERPEVREAPIAGAEGVQQRRFLPV